MLELVQGPGLARELEPVLVLEPVQVLEREPALVLEPALEPVRVLGLGLVPHRQRQSYSQLPPVLV